MRALVLASLLVAAPLAAQTGPAATASADAAAAPRGSDTTLSLNARVLAELRAQATNRAAQTAQYKGAVAVANQQTIEVQRLADESEADYAARVAAWRAKTSEACAAGNAEACAKLGG